METIGLTNVYHAALGGTLEQIFSIESDKLVYPQKSVVYDSLERSLCLSGATFSSDTYCLKESGDVTIDDVKKIHTYLTQTGIGQRHKQILVTCGLFKILDIGDLFKQIFTQNDLRDRKIMLAASRTQLRDKWYSDAMFNLGTAITYLRYTMQAGEIVSYDRDKFVYHVKKELVS